MTILDTNAGRAPAAPAMGGRRRSRVLGARALTVVFLAVMAAGALWHHQLVLGDHRAGAAGAERIILATRRVAVLGQTAAAAERSFALTGDGARLDPFFPALEGLSATTQRLQVLAADDRGQSARAATVSDLVGVRVRQMWTSIDSRRIGGASAARRAVENPQSRETERRLTEVLDAIAAAERAASSDRQADLAWLERALVAAGIGGGGLLFLIIDGFRLLRRRPAPAPARGGPVPA